MEDLRDIEVGVMMERISKVGVMMERTSKKGGGHHSIDRVACAPHTPGTGTINCESSTHTHTYCCEDVFAGLCWCAISSEPRMSQHHFSSMNQAGHRNERHAHRGRNRRVCERKGEREMVNTFENKKGKTQIERR